MSTRTRGLHQGTANHKPDCQCPPCKGRRVSAAEAYLKTIQEALDCKDPAKLAEKAQKLQSDLKDAELQISTARFETTEAKGISSSHSARAERLEKELKESQRTALTLQQDLDCTVLERDGLHDSLTETRKQLANAQATLKLSDARAEALKRDKGLLELAVTTAEKRGELATTHAIFEGNLKTIVVGVILSGVITYIVGRWAR